MREDSGGVSVVVVTDFESLLSEKCFKVINLYDSFLISSISGLSASSQVPGRGA